MQSNPSVYTAIVRSADGRLSVPGDSDPRILPARVLDSLENAVAELSASLASYPTDRTEELLEAGAAAGVIIVESPEVAGSAQGDTSAAESSLTGALAAFLRNCEPAATSLCGAYVLRVFRRSARADAGLGAASEITRARSLYFLSPGKLEIRHENVAPRAGEVLVESRIMGISHGTELHFYRGSFAPGPSGDALAGIPDRLEYPLKYGYMNAGLAAGRPVFAFFPHQDRFFAAADDLLEIPGGIALEDAVLMPSVETALGIVHDAAPSIGESVLVVGLGSIGLLTAEILAMQGVRVITLEPFPRRRAAAERAGIPSFEPGPVGLDEILRFTAGRGVDIAINTSGRGEGLEACIEAAAFEGLCVEASWYGDERVPLALGTRFHRKRLTVRASQVSSVSPRLASRWPKRRRFELVWQLVASLRPSKYITHSVPLEAAPEVFELISRFPEQTIQAALVP